MLIVAPRKEDSSNEADAFRRLESGVRRELPIRQRRSNEADAFRRLESYDLAPASTLR